MPQSQFEIVTLKSGIKSLRSLHHGETFHPGTGPTIEARILHVEQQRLVERCFKSSKFVIWDVGFGAAANVLTAIDALRNAETENCKTEIEIHSFDKTTAPIEFALENAEALGYLKPHEEVLQLLLKEKKICIPPGIQWNLHLGDFGETLQNYALPAPNAIFYDPYSASGNREMWTLEHFRLLWKCLDPAVPCSLTNYTRSTAVRATLLLAGFFVGMGCEIGEKAETTIASNQLDLLRHPLDQRWLKRVRNSTHSAPLRAEVSSSLLMSDSDFELLQANPQFRQTEVN